MGQIKNLEKINIIKKDKIANGLSFIKEFDKDNIIYKVSIFGSSVRDDCRDDSDIDICLYTDIPTEDERLFTIHGKLPRIMNNKCDILINHKIPDGVFKKNLKETEVVVYEN